MKRNIPVLALLLLLLTPARAQEQTTRIEKSMSILTDVMRQLDMNYFDTLNYDRMTEEGIRMMLRQVDPYTIYIPKERDTDLRIMTTGQYGGIGALIMTRDSMIYIAEPYEGMPAQVNAIRAGDRLVKVDG
ncbi:MAG: peptidase S41, partial [Paludibacteraceae bacterium]|nr:peptidase S41 [Paludibacteraceae bacterium]